MVDEYQLIKVNMKIIETQIPQVKIIEPKLFEDHRGSFYESFHQNRYQELAGIQDAFVQDNTSRSKQGVLRGLHYQTKHPQGKLVSVLEGEVFDVAVDIRRDSPTFSHWVGVLLSHKNNRQLWIPKGFAHGFLVLSPEVLFTYKCTDYYYPKHELSITYNDIDINIEWPKTNAPIQLSAKDKAGTPLKAIDENLLPRFRT